MENLISVIVPCYNQVQFLSETLDSVLAQTYVHWECIIVNDGSTDNTAEIAQRYCAKDSRFRYVEKENGGLSSARNVGLKEAKGDYIQFLDSDDLLLENKFKQQLEVAVNSGADVVVGHHTMFCGDRNICFDNEWSTSEYILTNEGFLYGWGVDFVIAIHSALFMRKFLYSHNIRFNEKVKAREDWLFWCELTNKGAKFVEIPQCLALYRVHSSSMSSDNEKMLRALMDVSFVQYEKILSEKDRDEYRNIMGMLILEKVKRIYRIDILNKRLNSFDCKLGRFLMFPFHYVRRCFKKKK